MSKTSLRSRSSLRNAGQRRAKKKEEKESVGLKPYGFCCMREEYDPDAKYNQRKPPYESSMTALLPINESPEVRLRTQYISSFMHIPKKRTKAKMDADVDGNPCVKPRGPLMWYEEDEIALGRNIVAFEKQKTFIEEGDRNAEIGKRNVLDQLNTFKESGGPRWYQDLNNCQMRNILTLEELMLADYEEGVTGRTQRALMAIGVTSTFVKIVPVVIRKLRKMTNLRPINFLREIYKKVTGKHFEDEGYKKKYDCNQRIILSSIAFLALPETVFELDKRLPPIEIPKMPPKPKPPRNPTYRHSKWPYEEPIYATPDWALIKKNLSNWRDACKFVNRPRVILAPPRTGRAAKRSEATSDKAEESANKEGQTPQNLEKPVRKEVQKKRKNSADDGPVVITNPKDASQEHKLKQPKTSRDSKAIAVKAEKKISDFSIPQLPGGSNQKFDFTISGLDGNAGPVEYKICGTLKPPFPKRKSWLGDKDAHYIVSGVSEHDDPPQCPVTFVMTGISHVTPDNSDEQFFAELKLGDGPLKVFPSGRKNLSKNWQEWLQDADEEFLKVENEANRLIKSIEATMRLVVPGPYCDSCCSCRQTRKTNLKWHDTKTPYMVVDSIAEGDDENKYIVGSMAMHSPLPTPPESTVNLLEVVASTDRFDKKLVINGITNDSGETTYYISGVMQDTEHIPQKTISKQNPPKSLRNVPACICTIEQMFNAGENPRPSTDDIPFTKKEGKCFGKKYRPKEAPAYTCKESPNDKSCRRNPFKKIVNELKRKRDKENEPLPGCGTGADDDFCAAPPKKKQMFTLPAFVPCGDEDGMAVCGGPWGAKNIPNPKVVAARLEEMKQILKSPPCGEKPGRAICGAPWGARVPIPPRPKKGSDEEDEDEEEEEEEDEEEKERKRKEKEAELAALKPKKKILKRDNLCDVNPAKVMADGQIVGSAGKTVKEPVYCQADNQWDAMRMAPTINPWGGEYEDSLKLTSANPSNEPHAPKKRRKNENENGENDGTTAKTNVKVLYSGKPASQAEKNPPGQQPSSKNQRQQPTTKSQSPQAGKNLAAVIPRNGKGTGQQSSAKSQAQQPATKLQSPQSGKKSPATSAKSNGKSRLSDAGARSTNAKGKNGRGVKSAKDSVKEKGKNGKVQKTKESGKGNGGGDNGRTKIKSAKEPGKHKTKDERATPISKGSEKSKDDQKSKKAGSTETKGRVNKNRVRSPKESEKATGEKKRKSSKYEFVNKYEERWLKREAKLKKLPPCKDGDGKEKTKKNKKKKDTQKVTQSLPPPPPSSASPKKTKMPKEYDVKPAIMPKESPKSCQREYADPKKLDDRCAAKPEDDSCDCKSNGEQNGAVRKSGPFGWKTASQQKLPPEKTLVYLAEPNAEVPMIPVRKGGKVCKCRQNRANKKILMYNIGGTVNQSKVKHKKAQALPRVIEGVYYATPPPSPRISDEFVPEYELYDSPYDMCLRTRTEESLKYMEQFLGPKNILPTRSKNEASCPCGKVAEDEAVYENPKAKEVKGKPNELKPAKGKDKKDDVCDECGGCGALAKSAIESKVSENRRTAPNDWTSALKDEGLVDFFVRCQDNIPCWLRCAKFTKDGCCVTPRRLEVRKPVCECKYERKVLRRDEAKKKWVERQQRLKTYRKQPLINVNGTSRPMETETKLMISQVKKIPREHEYVDDVKYCITGVAENYTMAPAELLVSGIAMQSPLVTPDPSKPDIPCMCGHRHWSPTKISEACHVEEVASHTASEESEPYVAYHSCAGEESCRPKSEPIEVPVEANQKDSKPKRRMSKDVDKNAKGNGQAKDSKKPVGQGKPPRDTKSDPEVQTSTPAPVKKEKEANKATNTVASKNHEAKDSEKQPPHSAVESSHSPKSKSPTNLATRDKGDGDNSEKSTEPEQDLYDMMKIELEKMAVEGFVLAQLPGVHAMPQLKFWIDYRKGNVYSDQDKKKLLDHTVTHWNDMESAKAPNIPTASINMNMKEILGLTFDRAMEMKRKIAFSKAKFLSDLRKLRVWETRAIWGSMEFGKFPSASFKEAFFTYLPGKEADGHVFRPWQTSERRKK